MRKVFFLIVSFSLLLLAKDVNSVAKILVVDKNAYDKIESVNILNGGLKKKIVVASSKVSQDDLKRYYPEYFLYEGNKCHLINKIELDDKIYSDIMPIEDADFIKKEIEKIKMIQALVDIGYKNNDVADLNKDSLKAFGIICDDSIMIRQKFYKESDNIGNLIIKKIDAKNNSVYLEVK